MQFLSRKTEYRNHRRFQAQNANPRHHLSSFFRLPSFETAFTLIELVMVIVILGIIGIMGADFISKGFKGFHDTENRAAMFEEGSLTLARMEREIHNAIPNAVDSVTLGADPTDLRFAMIDETAMRTVFGHYQEAAPTLSITDETAALAVGTVLSIYNRNWTDFSTATLANRRLYQVTAVAGKTMTLDSSNKPGVIASSPRQRFYGVDRAVRYYLFNGRIMRSEIKINAETTDPTNFPADNLGKPLATGIKTGSLSFAYTPASLTRNATVRINFILERGEEEVGFHKEVHIHNVP